MFRQELQFRHFQSEFVISNSYWPTRNLLQLIPTVSPGFPVLRFRRPTGSRQFRQDHGRVDRSSSFTTTTTTQGTFSVVPMLIMAIALPDYALRKIQPQAQTSMPVAVMPRNTFPRHIPRLTVLLKRICRSASSGFMLLSSRYTSAYTLRQSPPNCSTISGIFSFTASNSSP